MTNLFHSLFFTLEVIIVSIIFTDSFIFRSKFDLADKLVLLREKRDQIADPVMKEKIGTVISKIHAFNLQKKGLHPTRIALVALLLLTIAIQSYLFL